MFADVSQARPAGQHSPVKPERLEYIAWYIQKPLKRVAQWLVKNSFQFHAIISSYLLSTDEALLHIDTEDDN